MGYTIYPKGFNPGLSAAIAANNKKSLDDAIDRALNEGGKIELPGCVRDKFICDPLEPIPNDIQATLNICGQGMRNTVIETTNNVPFMVLGEEARTTTNAQQDWGAFKIADMAFTTQESPSAIAYEWRFAETDHIRVHYEGYYDTAVGNNTAEPKSWIRRFRDCNFVHNGRGIYSDDHGLWVHGCRFYWNDVHIERGRGSAHTYIVWDAGPSSVAQLKISGGGAVNAIQVHGYHENGYDYTTNPTTRPLNIDLNRIYTTTPAGLLLIEDATVWGFSLDTCFMKMQDSTWLVKIDNPSDKFVTGVIRGGLTGNNGIAGSNVIEIVQPSAANQNNIAYENVYASNGTWDNMSNDVNTFCSDPIGTGLNNFCVNS